MDSSSSKGDKVKRGYRACLHCRSRKAKCDLGDIDAPSSPPCSRCKRESRECVFAPSRRGGNNRKRPMKTSDDELTDSDVKPESLSRSTAAELTSSHPAQTFPYPNPPRAHRRMSSSSIIHPLRQSPPASSSSYYRPYPTTGSSNSHFSPVTSSSTHGTPQTRTGQPNHPALPPVSRNKPSTTPSPKRRRLHLNPPLHATDPSSIVVADMRNESDALQILALASGQAAIQDDILEGEQDRSGAGGDDGAKLLSGTMGLNLGIDAFADNSSEKGPSPLQKSTEPADLGQFPLVKLGILSEDQVVRLTEHFFRCHHHLFGWIVDVQCLGAPPTVGLVETLLLLAENLPRTPTADTPAELHALDCYLFDRHVSIRLGKGFWARGASVCFQGFSSSYQTGPVAALTNFPFLREIKSGNPGGEHPQEDLASLVQAYLELTQMMSNAHDVLYPNPARTRSLVVHGEYFKYIDEMARSLDGFKVLWRTKNCQQAHVERATIRAEEEYRAVLQQHKERGDPGRPARPSISLFPRGAAQSPDARYIFHMCDAARELLHLCVDNLYPGGALPYLPSRFLLWFTYGAIVLLKALYSGAMLRADHKKLCSCFEECSTDDDHPAVRYGRQLEALRKKLSGLSEAANGRSPPGGRSARLPSKVDSETAESRAPTNGVSTPLATANGFPEGQTPAWFQPGVGEASNMYSPQWQLPVTAAYTQTVVFPYPNTPSAGATTANSNPTPYSSTFFFPPAHQQPLGEVGVLPFQDSRGGEVSFQGDPGINLGFATLDDWFGAGGIGSNDGGSNAALGHNGGVGSMGGLDLQDFWMKVGPGEAQGGFPFR
ncbi:hypothetical protein IAR55_004048 [Kwoniella newhampshirensis]|uniref:Zn(2)-C6 fungal-type domain-containing protein n=1 Tax=Kwoniella newhampshirensis TaxID=1651941 RepID=A0AAW0YYN5_9TREE